MPTTEPPTVTLIAPAVAPAVVTVPVDKVMEPVLPDTATPVVKVRLPVVPLL
jgi:hypothetical protein